MAFLGALVGTLGALLFVLAVTSIPVLVAWYLWQLIQRQRKRREWDRRRAQRQPYDDAFDRELFDQATVNGQRDAQLRLLP